MFIELDSLLPLAIFASVFVVFGCAPFSAPASAVPTATPNPEAIQTPATSPYDGKWAGTTDQDKPVSFTVMGNAISFVRVEFVLPGCSLAQSIIRPQYFSGNTFMINQPDFQPMTIRGTFDTAETVAGIVTIGKQECGGPIMLRYQAAKQPAGA